MKKVLVLAAAVMLFAAPAMAVITGSAHDLSSTNGTTFAGSSDEICVYCHTPHGAGAAGTAPLWNRTTVNATNFYNDPAGTMNATTSLAGVNASDAILCLSCHDGASLTANLTNPPNNGGQPTFTGGNITGNANLGTDLSNDHPVGFDYTSAAADTEIRATPLNSIDVTFGSTNNQMWCSSCHDVHDNANGQFLVISNARSNLCLSCHIK